MIRVVMMYLFIYLFIEVFIKFWIVWLLSSCGCVWDVERLSLFLKKDKKWYLSEDKNDIIIVGIVSLFISDV